MSMKRRPKAKQAELWIATSDLARTPDHPFYERVNQILAEAEFDRFVEQRCARFYAAGKGRPDGMGPGALAPEAGVSELPAVLSVEIPDSPWFDKHGGYSSVFVCSFR